ncbi:MAG: mechanosensitive ion channel family protein [Deltaproteobacteria bacterium]|nr:mechanosensitive ion channel family protein [Deltaproteobacteria bacterium]
MPELSMEQAVPWLVSTGLALGQSVLRIVLIIVASYVGVKFLRIAIDRVEAMLIRAGEATEEIPGVTKKRVTTLSSVLRTIAVGLIWTMAIVVSLDQVGLDITPILAGAGIIGLAVGFGAQNLVRDIISGFFLILENQVRVGDVAIINGTGGLVEAITFRTVVLRDLSAVVHVFPNGSINTLSNMTKGWSAYVIDVGVAYKEDTDRVVQVMCQVDEEMRQDPQFEPKMLGPIEIFGVDNFGESEVTIKARLRTHPIQQWNVGREYRRRLKKAFDAVGIEIPFPHRTLYMGEASLPFQLSIKEAAAKLGEPDSKKGV